MEDGLLQEEEAKKIFGQIVAAANDCHNLNIFHQVIKLQNILRGTKCYYQADRPGLAIKCRYGPLLKGQCGTKGFYAPEFILGAPYDFEDRCVKLGFLLYFIST